MTQHVMPLLTIVGRHNRNLFFMWQHRHKDVLTCLLINAQWKLAECEPRPTLVPSTEWCRSATEKMGWEAVRTKSSAILESTVRPILAPIESLYATSYYWLILTYLVSCTVFKLWLIIGQIFAGNKGVSHFNALTRGDPLQKSPTTKNQILWATFLSQKVYKSTVLFVARNVTAEKWKVPVVWMDIE